jgi:Ca-activated chloride channel family protein
MIVVDSSGSMAGVLNPKGGQIKIALVREALRAALATASPRTKIGLAVFGHRPRTCSDTEILRTPQPADVDAMMAPLMQLRPRFRGPITFALREAAKQLPTDGSPRSIVLIHDGPDNCQQDVCAAAAELAAAGISAHVVSLGVRVDHAAKMACIWQATGGRQFKADAAEQVEAAIAEALRAASGEKGPIVAPGSWATTIAPPAPVPATGPAALHLRARWAPNADLAGVPIYWTIASKDAPEILLFDSAAANPVVPVTPGEYVVTVRSDLASASKFVAVRDDRPKAVAIVLGAAPVRVRAVAQRSGAPLADAVITIAAADGTPLAVYKAAEATTLLPSGSYRIGAAVGLVRAEKAVTVEDGQPAQVDIALNFGRLVLTAAAREAAAPPDSAPLFIVMEDDPPRGRREVARSAASQAEFALPPGTYYVITRQGGVEARERLEIGSGDVERRTLGTAVGHLELASSASIPLAGNLVSYTIKRLDDPDQEMIWTSQAAPLLSLPAGRYRIEGRYGLTNVATTRDVEIKAGQTLKVPIEHQVATLRVRLTGVGDGLADVTWEVRDEHQTVVWASSLAEDIAILRAGRYVVSALSGTQHPDRRVELRAGEAAVVEVRAQ